MIWEKPSFHIQNPSVSLPHPLNGMWNNDHYPWTYINTTLGNKSTASANKRDNGTKGLQDEC